MASVEDRFCSIDWCEDSVRARGWCNKHYIRWRKTGDPLGSTRRSIEDRFWEKVDPWEGPGGCWLWLGATDNGYGVFGVEGRTTGAHRFAYEILVGPIPDGLEIDHLCGVKHCLNPTHLDPVTRQINNFRAISLMQRKKTHCARGHALVGDNVILRGDLGPRRRLCRACGASQAP